MTNESYQDAVKKVFAESIEVKSKILSNPELTKNISEIAEIIAKAYERGNKVLLCGNGGSAADAQHIAAEFLIRLRAGVNRPSLPAIALATDTSSFTACCNDYDFDEYFARMVDALGNKGDVLIGISTSGKSVNVMKAFYKAKEKGIINIGLLGRDGGTCKPMCDKSFVVPCDATERIQESHITAGHAIVQITEDILIEKGVINKH